MTPILRVFQNANDYKTKYCPTKIKSQMEVPANHFNRLHFARDKLHGSRKEERHPSYLGVNFDHEAGKA